MKIDNNQNIPMDETLWQRLTDFDFDQPISEFGFSARLGKENNWTADFTKNAITEYKKFMYLAATSEVMVSPSEIIDLVWHEHLIFTKSYTAFCEISGKRIEHIPSTHNHGEFEKFKLAKARTTLLYEAAFGKQPEVYWNYPDIHAPLKLKKSRLKIGSFLLFGIVGSIMLLYPAYCFLKPIYIHIQNPNFINYYLLLCLTLFAALEMGNRKIFMDLVQSWNAGLFILRLNPNELVYLKSGNISTLTHGIVNKMITDGKIETLTKNKIQVKDDSLISDPVEFGIAEMIKKNVTIFYGTLLRHLALRPTLHPITFPMDAFKKYIVNSEFFSKVFYANFVSLAIVFLLGLARLTIGIERNRPVSYLALALIILFILVVAYLLRLTRFIGSVSIPTFYKNEIIKVSGKPEDSEWAYFLLGSAVLTSSFAPMTSTSFGSNSGNSCSSGCGSSCGSSCGGGCGGCGGD